MRSSSKFRIQLPLIFGAVLFSCAVTPMLWAGPPAPTPSAQVEFCRDKAHLYFPHEFEVPEKSPLWKDVESPPLGERYLNTAADWLKVKKDSQIKILVTMTDEEKLKIIGDFPLMAIIPNPGHNPIRSVDEVWKIASSILTDGYKLSTDEAKKPILNLMTDAQNRLIGIECNGGHHRILAQILRIYTDKHLTLDELNSLKIRDLVTEDLLLPVNRRLSDGRLLPGKYPAHALDFSVADSWPAVREESVVNATYAARPSWMGEVTDPLLRRLIEERKILIRTDKGERSGELLIDPEVSNYAIGSRETLGFVFRVMVRRGQPQVAFLRSGGRNLPSLQMFMTWDNQGYDEILIVPTRESWQAKESAVKVLNDQLAEKNVRLRVNLYKGVDYQSYVNVFGTDSFESRLRQIYSSLPAIKDLSP